MADAVSDDPRQDILQKLAPLFFGASVRPKVAALLPIAIDAKYRDVACAKALDAWADGNMEEVDRIVERAEHVLTKFRRAGGKQP